MYAQEKAFYKLESGTDLKLSRGGAIRLVIAAAPGVFKSDMYSEVSGRASIVRRQRSFQGRPDQRYRLSIVHTWRRGERHAMPPTFGGFGMHTREDDETISKGPFDDGGQPGAPRKGIVSFITAASYLRGPGFTGMRQRMREAFDEIWIIDLGATGRRRRTRPWRRPR